MADRSNAIITIKLSGIIQSVDKNCCEVFGYTQDELVGQNIKKLVPHPYKNQHDTYLENYRRTQIPKIIGRSRIVEGQHKDGSIFAIKLSVSKLENRGQETLVIPTACGSDGMNETNCPVVSLKNLDDESLFIGIIDKLEDTAASVTADAKGTIVACNENVKELFGYTAAELKGNNMNMLIPQYQQETHAHNFMDGRDVQSNSRAQTRNVHGLHKSGMVLPISLQIEPVVVGPITLYRGKIEAVNDLEAMLVLDKGGNIVSCDHNFVKPLFGYSYAQLVGQNISMLVPEISGNSRNVEEHTERPHKRPKMTEREVSWKIPGLHTEQLHHKDGSTFAGVLEISTFREFSDELLSARITRSESQKTWNHPKMIGDYYVSHLLGRGGYGKVNLGFHKITQQKVAIKTLQKSAMPPLEIERTKREIKIMESLNHPNVIKFHEMIETDKQIHIIMEHGGGTLFSYVLERGGLGESDSKNFFVQILRAVKYCHDRNIVHRDIKHQNILLDHNFDCKLIDFGLSQYVQDGVMRSTFCGTPAYSSPQMLLGKQYEGKDIDVWSLGVVLYSMITGKFPFDNLEQITSGSLEKPQSISDDCFELIQWMLQVETRNRATLKQVMSHKWVCSSLQQITSIVPLSDPTKMSKEQFL